jgi:hypothetical protein
MLTETARQETQMLYQEKALGRSSLWQRLAGRLALRLRSHRPTDLDLVGLNPHLSRDIGLWDGQAGIVARPGLPR